MSFKIKKWGGFGTIRATDHHPTFVASYMRSEEHISYGMTFPWRGRIVFCGYDSADSYAPIWMYFDPRTYSWAGPYPAPSFVGNEWMWHSYFTGDDRDFRYYPDHLVAFGADRGGYAAGYFYGLNRNFEWVNFLSTPGSPPAGATDIRTWLCTMYGEDAGEPVMLLTHSYKYGGSTHYELWKLGPGGGVMVDSGHPWKWATSWGSTEFDATMVGGKYVWRVMEEPNNYPWPLAGVNIYGAPVTVDNYEYPLLHADVLDLKPVRGGAYCTVQERLSEEGQYHIYNARTSDLGEEVQLPSKWEIIAEREDVSITLDDGDLDGRDHSVAVPPQSEPTFHPEWGYFVAIYPDRLRVGENQITVYALDPVQPVGRPAIASQSTRALGWAGDYAINTDLCLRHILPFPDQRDPSGGSSRPPEELRDGHIVTATEVFRRSGAQISFERNIRIDLTSYPYTSDDWDWPGTEDGCLDGFWELFAGRENIVVGRMPDYMWGAKGPTGQDVMYGLGLPTQNLKAPAGEPTHVLSQSRTISGTTFASALSGVLSERRRHLVCCTSTDRFGYCETGLRIGMPPLWAARGGRIDEKSKTWTTLVDFAQKGPPGLGETGWTVWSVVPIAPCRALLNGGWLVGATLYFDPWVENEWEWTPGQRQATFRGTQWHHVPAYPGFDGPFQTDTHEPILLSAYDEWTANRSLYGPDALLVYDRTGNFVECLNTEAVYPPNGREVFVTPGPRPRIVFRVYRWGTYSDSAEGWGQYHRFSDDIEIQAPLYVCYELMNLAGQIVPGCGSFCGFVDMHEVAKYNPKDASWRWDSVAPTLYDWEYPKIQWSPPGSSFVRAGSGGLQVVPLTPVSVCSDSGVLNTPSNS